MTKPLPPEPPLRVVIVDDHEAVRLGIQWLLKDKPPFVVVGTAATGDEALAQCEALHPDIVVLDIRIGGLPADRVLHALKSGPEPGPRVIVYSAFAHRQTVLEMLRLGADSFIVKSDSMKEFARALEALRTGGVHHDPAVDPWYQDYLRNRVYKSDLLTGREREVLRLVGGGRSSKEIAAALKVTEDTVESHRRRIMRKTRSRNMADLAVCAMAMGLV